MGLGQSEPTNREGQSGLPAQPAGPGASPAAPYRPAGDGARPAGDGAQHVPTPPGPFVRPAGAPQPVAPYTGQPPAQPPAQPPQPAAQPPYNPPQAVPQPPPYNPPQTVRAQAAPYAPPAPPPQLRPALTVLPTTGTRCPHCGSPVAADADMCPVCGEGLQVKPAQIRCRHCGRRASSQLTICPSCGRALHAAPSRWLTVGLPTAAVLLVLALIAFQTDTSNPLGWAAGRVRAGIGWIASFSAGLDPQLEVIPAAEPAVADLPTAAPAAPGTPGAAAVADQADHVDDSGALTGTVIVTAGAPITVMPNLPGAPVALATVPAAPAAADALTATAALPTPSPLPTATPLPMPTATLPPTDTPGPTNTPAAVTYTVVRGDTAQAIALRYGVALDALLLANNLTEDDATLLQPGQTLTIPLPAGGTGTAAGALYTVRAGDTLAAIAARTGVPVEVLQQANGLSNAAAASLHPGDSLLIPAPTPTPGPSPTPTLTPAPTVPPTAAPTAAPTASAAGPIGMRHPAPVLRAPLNGVTIRCSAEARLQWEPIPAMQAADKYRVHLGIASGRDASGNLQITWLIEQAVDSTITQVGLPRELCDKSSAAMGNEWRWYIEAVDVSGAAPVPVSPTSQVWGFAWKE